MESVKRAHGIESLQTWGPLEMPWGRREPQDLASPGNQEVPLPWRAG